MRSTYYDNQKYKLKQSNGTKKLWEDGVYNFLITPLQTRICSNIKCQKSYLVKPYDPKRYCSRSCSVSVNNSNRKKTPFCKVCTELLKAYERKYCSVVCQQKDRYEEYIQKWKSGLISGNIGIRTKHIANFLRKYLLNKYDYKCSICGWNSVNPSTKLIPLEVNHIDGDADNNIESNLQLLCPNCHSLTPNFRNLNKGKGRRWRKTVI